MYEDGEWQHPDTVTYQQGVYVKSSSSCIAEVEANWPVSGNPVPEDQRLEKGWNMISVKSNVDAANLQSTCTFEEYNGDKFWSYTGQDWKSFNEGLLTAHKGYYVKVSEGCEIGTSEEPPTPEGGER